MHISWIFNKMQKFEQHQIIEKFEQNVDSVFRKESVRLYKKLLGEAVTFVAQWKDQ